MLVEVAVLSVGDNIGLNLTQQQTGLKWRQSSLITMKFKGNDPINKVSKLFARVFSLYTKDKISKIGVLSLFCRV